MASAKDGCLNAACACDAPYCENGESCATGHGLTAPGHLRMLRRGKFRRKQGTAGRSPPRACPPPARSIAAATQ
eukprot:6189298-Pleurochrysis_carterae.AAC.2